MLLLAIFLVAIYPASSFNTLQSALTPLTESKLTFVCEVVLSGLDLDANIGEFSHILRTKARPNGLILSGTKSQIAQFCDEQASARGSFPEPLNVIVRNIYGEGADTIFATARKCGAGAVLIDWNGKDELALGSAGDLDVVLRTNCESLSQISEDSEILGRVKSVIIDSPQSSPPSLGIPILGGLEVVGGAGKLGSACDEVREVGGYSGVCLFAECMPGFDRASPFGAPLGVIGGFWRMAIPSLKTNKSSQFGFSSKFKLEKDVPMEWFNYQKDIMQSGALGSVEKASGIDTDNGDFIGF